MPAEECTYRFVLESQETIWSGKMFKVEVWARSRMCSWRGLISAESNPRLLPKPWQTIFERLSLLCADPASLTEKVICCALSVGNNVFDYKLLAVDDLTASHGPMSWFVALNSSSQYQRHVEKVCNRRRVVNDAATHAFISSLEFSWQTEWQKHPVG